MKRYSFFVLFAFIFFPPFLQSAVEAPKASFFIQRGDDLLREITAQNARKAIAEYRRALEADPDSYDAHWKTARAYCLILDLKTGALIDEKEELKPFLAEVGQKAEHFGAEAYRLNPKGKDGLVWYNAGYSYSVSSLGTVKAIMQGAGDKLQSLARELIAEDEAYHGAFGYRMLGRFYLKAPFPAGSKAKALENLEKAVEIAPNVLLNHFFLGEAYEASKKTELAENQYHFVIRQPSAPQEKHLEKFLKDAALARLASLTSQQR